MRAIRVQDDRDTKHVMVIIASTRNWNAQLVGHLENLSVDVLSCAAGAISPGIVVSQPSVRIWTTKVSLALQTLDEATLKRPEFVLHALDIGMSSISDGGSSLLGLCLSALCQTWRLRRNFNAI
jgi:hypothetical protein